MGELLVVVIREDCFLTRRVLTRRIRSGRVDLVIDRVVLGRLIRRRARLFGRHDRPQRLLVYQRIQRSHQLEYQAHRRSIVRLAVQTPFDEELDHRRTRRDLLGTQWVYQRETLVINRID